MTKRDILDGVPESVLQEMAAGIRAEMIGDFDAAVEHFQSAANQLPGWAEAWNSLGWAQAKRGRAGVALAYFDQAIKQNRSCTMAWVNKGITLKNLGQY